MALETIVITLVLLVPTVYWVHLKLPRMRPVIGFLALIPFVVAPIILVVGLLDVFRGTPAWFYAEPYGFLAFAYVILAFPYMYFSLDTGFRAIDVHTLTEASQSLGAGWTRTLLSVILPNIKNAALAGSFLTLAIVMGEYTIASLSQFYTFPVYIQYINQNKAFPAGAVTLLSFGITWAAMLALLFFARGRRPGLAESEVAMATVELQQLRRLFGDVVALDGIDVSIASGEFLSLLGPSGCGKTTALRLIAGFDRPTSGRVLVGGSDVTGVPPNKRGMGMVFQAYSLFPNMTAERNVEFGLKIRKQSGSARRERVSELLDLVGLGHAAKRYPHQLSGGMQQRVALARALAIEPSVLLLDEPLSALDAKVRVQLREEIRRIQIRLGITTIYVTHDQEEALSISDRVAVLSQRPDRADRPAGRDLRRAGDAVRRRLRRHHEPRRVGRGRPRPRRRRGRRHAARRRRRTWTPARPARPAPRATRDRRGRGRLRWARSRPAKSSPRRSSAPPLACTSRPPASSGRPTSPPSGPVACRSAPG